MVTGYRKGCKVWNESEVACVVSQMHNLYGCEGWQEARNRNPIEVAVQNREAE